MLSIIKKALRITTDAFDDELNLLITAGLLDLGIGDIKSDKLEEATADALVTQAVTTYVKARFGDPENAEKLHESYIEQKSQLITSSNYTTWESESNG